MWMKTKDPAKTNPNVVISGGPDGKPFKSADGHQQQLIFGMFDENGDRGKGWLTKVRDTCSVVVCPVDSLWFSIFQGW